MLNKLIFDNKTYTFSEENLNNIYKCILQNETLDDNDIRYVLSFISNSIVHKKYEDLDLHEFILDGNYRVSNLICNIANVFGGDKANKFAMRLSDNLYSDFPAINLDYTEAICASEASDIWVELFGNGTDFEQFKFLLTLIALYDMAEFDYEQQCKDYKELRKVTFFNGMGVKQIEDSDRITLKPLFSLFDTPLEDYVEIAGIWVPPTLLSVMFKTDLNSMVAGAINEMLMESQFHFKYQQLSGKVLKIDRRDYSEWILDPKLYGMWYGIHKSTHPVFGTDYSLTIEAFNEDGSMYKHIQHGVKNLMFSKDFSWGKYVSKWKTKNDEIMIVNEDLDLKHCYKYELKDGTLTICDQVYYRTFEEALESAKK